MIVDTKSVGMTPEILASNDYQAVPIKVSEALKAGIPVKNDGSKSTDGTDAIGILLYDVDPARNPNGAVVVDGIINWEKCQAINNSDLSAVNAEDIAKKMPHLVFRDKISGTDSKTYVGGTAAE